MKKLKNVLVTLLSVLMMLTLFVGCSDNSAEDSDALGYVSFSDGGGSRSLETENETLYGVEDLYWAYTAEKIRGNYTTGQSAVATSYSISTWGTDQVTDGKVAKSCNDGTTLLYLTPVKQGPAKGLKNVQVGPFSVGQWRIKLYGFKSYNALAVNPDGSKGAFTDPVYRGTTGALPWVKNWTAETTRTADDIVSIDVRVATGSPAVTPPVKTLVFALDGETNGKAELAFNPITMTVPEDQAFYGKEYGSLVTDIDPAVRVLVVDLANTDSSGVPALIAVSSTDIKFVESDGTTVNNKLKLESGKVVTTGNDGNALNSFSFVLDNNKYGKKGTSDPQLDVNQFNDGIAELAFITLYKDSFTVGQNPYTMTVADDPAGTWKGRYEYTDSSKWVTSGDIPAALKDFLEWAGDKYIQPDGSVKATTGAAGEEALVQGYALVGNISAYQVGFTSGVRTILGGDLNDLFGAKGETEKPKFGTAVAKIAWKEAEAGQPVDKYNPYAQPGTAVYDVDAVGKTFTLYDSVEKALYAYKTYYSATDADNHVSADAPYVELLANIDTKDEVKFKGDDGSTDGVDMTVDVPVLTGKYFVDGLTIPTTATGKLILIPAYDKTKTGAERYTSGQYTFEGNTTEDVVIKNFQFKDNKIWLYTDVATATSFTNGVKVTLDSKNGDTTCAAVSVYHSGVASEVNIVNLGNAEATTGASATPAVGYFLGTRTDSAAPDAAVTSIGTLNVIKGRVEIGGRATVNKLVSAAAAAGNVVLKARENAVVQSYGYGTAGADGAISVSQMYRTWNTTDNKSEEYFYKGVADTDAENNGFKAVVLDGNADGTGMDQCYWLYGIEGLPVKLPAFTSLTEWTAPASAVTGTGNFCFMHWTSAENGETALPIAEDDIRFTDGAYVVPGIDPEDGEPDDEDVTLYALWAQPLGGRVFYLASTFDKDSYHFYGVADGSVNELTEWYDAAVPTYDPTTGAVTGTDARVVKLDSAYYYSTTSTYYDEVLVAYATRPADPSDSVTLTFSVFNDGTNSNFKWDSTPYVPADPSGTPAESGPVSVSTETGIGKGKTNSAAAETTITPITGLLWDVVKNKVGEYGVPAADRTITDWFVGSKAEHTELFKICDLYRLNRMWSSEQGATETGTTPFYTHALCWNVSKGKWEDAPKTESCSFIPMRSIPSNPTP